MATTQPTGNTTQPTGNTTQQSFFRKYPRTTGIIGNAALGAAQSYVENKLGINDDFIDRYYQNSSGHPMLGEFAGDTVVGLINPAAGAGLIGSSLMGGGLKYINKKAGGIDLYGDGDLGQFGDLMEKPGRAIKFALDNTIGRLFHGGRLGGAGYDYADDANVKFGDSARLAEINENGGLIDSYTILTDKYPELKSYFKPIDSKKYLGLTMDQLRNTTIPADNKLNPVSSIFYNTMTDNGHYHLRDMYRFMDKSMGLDPSLFGIGSLLDKGIVGVDLTPEFYKEFVLSDYFKGDKNAELKRLGFDPQQVFAEQHAKEVKQQQQQQGNISKYVQATEQGIKQGKWVSDKSDKSDVQKDQLANGDDSPTIPKHEKNTVESSQQPNVHKNNATDQYLQYLMYRDYQKDKQRAESQKDMGLIPLLLAAYGMAKIGG